MKHLRNLRGRLTYCAVTTFVMGVGTQVMAQNQPATQNPSDPQTRVEQRPNGSEQARQAEQGGPQDRGPRQTRGLGLQFETQSAGGQGLEISNVDPNGSGAQAGLQPHDRLISIDGRPFRHHRHAKAYLSGQAGRVVPLVIERNGRRLMLQFVPSQPDEDSGWVGVLLFGENEMAPNGQNGPATPTNAAEGNSSSQNAPGNTGSAPGNAASAPGNNSVTQAGSPATPERSSNSATGGQNAPGQPGARVAQIYPGSPAARAGLQPGDLVTQVNGQKIDDPAEFVALIHEMKPQTKAEFDVMRDNQPQRIPVTIGSRSSEYAEAQFGAGQGQAGPDPNALQKLEEEVHQLREEIHQLREQLQKK